MLGLLAATLASAEARGRLRAAALAPLLLGLYVGWSYLSVLWAQSPGDALDGANRTLLYCCVFALFTALPLGGRARGALVVAWPGIVLAAGVAAVAAAAGAATPAGHFVLGRLAAPISYPDADAALFLTAALPLLVLGSRRETSVPSRAVAGAGTTVLAGLAVLCQSRGSLVALPLALLLLALGRGGLRRLLHAAVAAVAVAPALPALLDVYPAVVAGRGWADATARAGAWLAASAATGAAGFAAAAALDRRVEVPPRVRAGLRTGLLALAVGAAAVAVAVAGRPLDRLQHAWHDFATNTTAPHAGSHLASGFGTSRYDVWRVAFDQFRAHPLAGVGADNYVSGYLRHGRGHEVSRYPMSLELRSLSETGIVGGVLFLGFLGVAFARAVRAGRRDAVALACLAGGLYWLLHASIDWFWEYPALTAPGLALLALAGAPREPVRAAGRRALALAAAPVALAAAAALALPWVAVREVDAALASGAGRHAYSLLRSAASLNPLSEQPALAEAAVAAGAGDRERERRALEAALARNPGDWYPHFMLGIVAGREHRLAEARAQLAQAHRMSPNDLVVVYAQRRLAWGEPLTEREAGRILLEVTSTLRGVRQR